MTSPTCITVTVPPQLSLTPVTDVIFAAGTDDAQDTVIGAGQVNDGGVWSFTTMICVHVALLPHISVAR